MIKICYGSGKADREKFIFERLDPDRKTIIIVPDQFSLQMERDVLAYFREKEGRAALLNLMVCDFSSLGNKVVKAAGGRAPELIDKYGRHMLLSVIISRLAEKNRLGIYSRMGGRNSFTAGMNQLISEMKRFRVSPEETETAGNKSDSFLRLKLADITEIYSAYEEAIEGRFTDTEDYMAFYGELMESSELIKDADVWVYGFDTFTPLNMEVLRSILRACGNMNIVMMCGETGPEQPENLFDLTHHVMDRIKELAEEAGSTALTEKIPEPASPGETAITLVEAQNIYDEAEKAAAYITGLVRDRGYRYSDITVICNDMDVRGRVLKRTFDRWGIPAFADRRRKVLHQPVVRFILSFLEVISSGYDGDSIMEMAGSGLMGWKRADEEILANYVREAGIRGSGWKKPFTWMGTDDRGSRYSEDDLKRLNEMRSYIVDVTEKARNEMGRRNTATEKTEGLYGFLEDDFSIREKIGRLMQRQQELGLAESADETGQSWNMICGIFTQIIRVIGEEKISNIQLWELVSSGLEEMEIGLVPSVTDTVIIGTMQRTRISRTRSLIITAANEGVLPLQMTENGILTGSELETLENMKICVAKKDAVRQQEEQLAIYRMLSLPDDELYMTCSLSDEAGKSAAPSSLFTLMKEMPGVRFESAMSCRHEPVESSSGSVSHMADALRKYVETGEIHEDWLAAVSWYLENDRDSLKKIERGIDFDNALENLERDLADSLYFGDAKEMHVSASRLEIYSGCPFRYFIEKGLRADEPRKFEVDGRSRGDVYHDALQKLSRSLMPEDGVSVTSPESPWMKISREECRRSVEEIICSETAEYREGLYENSGENRLQRRRIVDTCSDIAWAMIKQVRKSSTAMMYFEEPFGFGSQRLKPLEIELENGRKAVLQGRIDRIDVMTPGTGNPEAARIIDYKTGKVEINREHIEKGYRLQLMVYMNAVSMSPAGMNPAGVFYFTISDLDVNAAEEGTPSEKGETAEDRIEKACRLDGILVDDENLLRAMDDSIEPKASSTAIPVKQLKNGDMKNTGNSELISQEEFQKLCRTTADHVERICREIQSGNISIAPKKEKARSGAGGQQITACTYCGCRSICMFDTSFRNCRYEMI